MKTIFSILGVIFVVLLVAGGGLFAYGAYRGHPTVHAVCRIGNIWGSTGGKHARQVAQGIGDGWMLDATVCSLGSYVVAVPTHPHGDRDTRIWISHGGKMFVWKDRQEILIADPDSRHKGPFHPIVNIIEGKGNRKIARMWYQTQRGPHNRYVFVDDLNFDGQADQRIVRQGNKAKQNTIWYKGQWHQLKQRKLTWNGHKWNPVGPAKIKMGDSWKTFTQMKFENGQWHLQIK